MRMLRTAAWIAACLALQLSGCNGKTSSGQAPGQQPSQAMPLLELPRRANPPVADVPIPIDFEEDMARNRLLHTGMGRFVDHLYKGRAERYAVVRFFKREMPVSRWTEVTYMQTRGEHALEFEKGTERCRIRIYKGSWFHPTYIEVRVWTVGRIEPPGAGPAKGNSK